MKKKVFLYIIKIDDTIISYYHYIINKIQYIGHMGNIFNILILYPFLINFIKELYNLI